MEIISKAIAMDVGEDLIIRREILDAVKEWLRKY